jgi:hypothetical protein
VQSPIRARDQSNKYKLYLLTLNPCPPSPSRIKKITKGEKVKPTPTSPIQEF